MTFNYYYPLNLVDSEKTRLKEALKQFAPEHRGNKINYSEFYKDYNSDYFMQSDILREIRIPIWNIKTHSYDKNYTNAIIVSNTCDISINNSRNVNPKQCLLAPLFDFNEYLKDLKERGYDQQRINTFEHDIKSQLITNILYLPTHFREKVEYIALLDRLFWFPTNELNSYSKLSDEDRIASLSYFGFYLFILKMSYHLCRLPEEPDRGQTETHQIIQNANTTKNKRSWWKLW